MNCNLKSLIYSVFILLLITGCVEKENRSAANGVTPEEPSDFVSVFTSRPEERQSSDQIFKTEHMWDAKVTISDGIFLGESKHGWRRIVPITGGTFEGLNIRGEVVPGGEDWQLTRPDGDTELYARYLLKTHDGYLIQVINRVLMHFPTDGEKAEPYIRSVVDLEAPTDSPYDHLNHAIFLGTLTQPTLKPGEKSYVVIGVYKVL
ncbi:MAG: DUF3237 family protein [Candidatus Aminicenantes bacterium]|nr:DUF3237 family protein [Candidatus Aminicenantes bacterium]